MVDHQNGNNSNGNRKKSNHPISYRPPKDLRDQFLDRVRESGLSVSAYITRCVFEKTPPRRSRRSKEMLQDLAKLLAICAEIRDRLKAQDPIDGERSARDLLHQTNQSLDDIRTGIFHLLGRKP